MSVARYISGTIYHMIFIYDTHVCIKESLGGIIRGGRGIILKLLVESGGW